MEYRIANKSDCDELTHLRMQMRKELDTDCCENNLFAKTKDFFLRNIENGNHIAIICEDEEHVIAMIGLSFFEMLPTTKSPNGKVARLMNMYVVPQYRHMGIARKLLEMSVSYAKEHSYGKIMLNPSSMGKKLYLNYGFQLADDEYEFYIK